jgi:hypothetical protein
MATKKKTQSKRSAEKPTAKASAKPAAKKGAKAGTAKQDTAKKAAGKKSAAPAASGAAGPRPVQTGKGAAPLEVGKALIDLVRAGRGDDVEKKWWAPTVVSVEGMGVSMEWAGEKSARQKNAAWEADHVVHGVDVEGPFVGATGFAIRFKIDVETKSTKQREKMEEIGVYTVRDGKIVREEFMYKAG